MTNTCPHCGATIHNFSHLRRCPISPDNLRAIIRLMRGTDWKLNTYLAIKPKNMPGKTAINTAGNWKQVMEAVTREPMVRQKPVHQPTGGMLGRLDTGWEEHAGLPVLRRYEERIGGRECVVSVIR